MLFLCLGIGADVHATLHAASELEGAVAQREQGIVLAATDVLAGMELGAALTNDDVAGVRESRDRYGWSLSLSYEPWCMPPFIYSATAVPTDLISTRVSC